MRLSNFQLEYSEELDRANRERAPYGEREVVRRIACALGTSVFGIRVGAKPPPFWMPPQDKEIPCYNFQMNRDALLRWAPDAGLVIVARPRQCKNRTGKLLL